VVPTKVVITELPSANPRTVFTRCDGVEFLPTEKPTFVSLTISDPWVSSKRLYLDPHGTQPCSIPQSECARAYSAFSSATSSYMSSVYSAHFAGNKPGVPPSIQFHRQQPLCTPRPPACPAASDVGKCSLQFGEVSVLYWETKIDDYCGAKSTIAPTPTKPGPRTAVFQDMTITSPAVLIVLTGVQRHVKPPSTLVENESDLKFTSCGPPINATVQVDAKNLTSIRQVEIPTGSFKQSGTWKTRTTITTSSYPFNFADLEPTQLAVDAYAGAGGCQMISGYNPEGCDKVWRILPYHPSLSAPGEILTAHPEFEGCDLGLIYRGRAKFIPITEAAQEGGLHVVTRYGRQMNVGPLTTRIETHDPQFPRGYRIQDTYPPMDFLPPGPVGFLLGGRIVGAMGAIDGGTEQGMNSHPQGVSEELTKDKISK
jgi:hypothetical protein